MKKNIFTKIVSVIVCFLMIASLASCASDKKGNDDASGADTSKTYKIGIIQYVSHPSLDNCYNGIVAALNESSIADRIVIDRQIGSDSSPDTDCGTYAGAMVAKKYDLIFAIATPAATAAYAATEGTDIPVIFCAVSDPVAAELVDSLDNPGGLCSGTSDVLDFDAQLNLIQAMQPDVKTIGIIYTSSEANSISHLAKFRDAASKRGLEVNAKGIQNDSDIPSTASALVKEVDCINNFTDNKVVNNLSVLLEAANDAGIPVYGSEVEQVKNGCLASVSIDYVALGKVTGNMGLDVLGGADIRTMAVKTISDATPVVNTEVLAALGMTMPESYTNAEKVTTNKD